MEDKNSELLFEYLRSILYDKKIQPLDVEQLDEPFRKLGRGLQYFAKTFTETKQYAAALSRGNLSVQPPPRENFLCENLKNIHANLNHLTWQAKQVAKGDYSQTVSYLGEFSEAFNTMTQQLKAAWRLLSDGRRPHGRTAFGQTPHGADRVFRDHSKRWQLGDFIQYVHR